MMDGSVCVGGCVCVRGCAYLEVCLLEDLEGAGGDNMSVFYVRNGG